ncbi:DUF4097 family beta strand repeat-containing protein [Nocardioides pacificus]
MTKHQFATPQPVALHVELDAGTVHVTATEAAATDTRSIVTVAGRDAYSVVVTLVEDRLEVLAPRSRVGFLGRDVKFDIRISVPAGSRLTTRTGSADLASVGELGTAHLRAGSGTIRCEVLTDAALIETGSGSVALDEVHGELRVKSGSGDVQVRYAAAPVAVSTGSGDVHIETSTGPTAVKTGSGSLRVDDAGTDVALRTGSGDLDVRTLRGGRLTAKAASGDVRVGVPAGLPVWTDISTVSGAIRSDLVGGGAPAVGADHVELRATTVSGNVVLTQVPLPPAG